MSIKVLDVAGDNLTPGQSAQDFILNSHPVMMVGHTRPFLQLLQAVDAGGARPALFLTHPQAAAVALWSRRHATSRLEISVLEHDAVSLRCGACRQSTSCARVALSDDAAAQSADRPLPAGTADRTSRPRGGPVRFLRPVSRRPAQNAESKMPASNGGSRTSPSRRVAGIRIPAQRIDDAADAPSCERLSFNPWNALPDHRPLGDFNRARREMYAAMAAFRSERAGA